MRLGAEGDSERRLASHDWDDQEWIAWPRLELG